jgi:hypothetical protein
MLDRPNLDAVLALAAEAGRLSDSAERKLGLGGEDAPRVGTLQMAEALSAFHFPDDLWVRVIYDLVLATRRGELETGTMVAALVPIYFGRVGSFVIENRNVTTTDAEERVERQARQFELLKPYLVERWTALDAEAAAADPGRGR